MAKFKYRKAKPAQPMDKGNVYVLGMLRRREDAIVQAVDNFCRYHLIESRIMAGAKAHALRVHRNGASAAAAIAAGKRRATDLAWGEPEGAA